MNSGPEPPGSGLFSRRGVRAKAPRPLRITISGATDQGRERSSNEDRFLIAPLPGEGGRATCSRSRTAWAGCTGARWRAPSRSRASSSTPSPRCASSPRSARRTARMVLVSSAPWSVTPTRGSAEEGARRRELEGMATTLTVAVILGRALFVAHIGDSRCYLLRRRALDRITSDQTVAAELMRRGLIAPGVALHHRFRHVLTDFVGGGDRSSTWRPTRSTSRRRRGARLQRRAHRDGARAGDHVDPRLGSEPRGGVRAPRRARQRDGRVRQRDRGRRPLRARRVTHPHPSPTTEVEPCLPPRWRPCLVVVVPNVARLG